MAEDLIAARRDVYPGTKICKTVTIQVFNRPIAKHILGKMGVRDIDGYFSRGFGKGSFMLRLRCHERNPLRILYLHSNNFFFFWYTRSTECLLPFLDPPMYEVDPIDRKLEPPQFSYKQ